MGGSDKESYSGERGESLYRRPSQFVGNRDQSEAGISDKRRRRKTDLLTRKMDGCVCERL